ncbi:CaiB/BaiF CoA transferase family protein [Nitratireductor alexandrii]|uniref:CaiB/BaiF CoA transferase family protein n=1 Tax=Nitratireductor alexandrii TaxID=2448161 RepID=UPI000FDA03F8|nr:CoA transferase [Nitratireductor alexandrii]
MTDAPKAPFRVIDFSQVMAGPFCTRLLADVGAEVIKVEPEGGESMRGRPPVRDGASSYFGALNAGKRSVTLDLKSEQGLARARALIASADVVVENFRPGVMARLGLGWDRLSELNPRLVYCAISGFGQSGAAATRPAYAPMIHAASGFDLTLMGFDPPANRPAPTGMFFADVLAGVFAWGAIQAALLERERSGLGQLVDVALMDCILSMMVYEVQEVQFPQANPRHVYVPVKTIDGFIVTVPLSDKNFQGLRTMLGDPDWAKDPIYATAVGRQTHWAEMMVEIEAWTRSRSGDDCVAALMAAGVPTSRYRTVAEALTSDEARERGILAPVSDASGEFKVPNPPFKFSRSRAHVGNRVPEVGEGNDEFFG